MNTPSVVSSAAQIVGREPKVHQLQIGSYNLRVAVWPGKPSHTLILLFNGVGGNLELLAPFVDALGDAPVIMFDVPGVGGSLPPPFFYRLPAMARLAVKVLRKLGHERADVIGVSWGGALAQQFAHTAPSRCRRLVLCATTCGAMLAWPPSPRVLAKLLTPARYLRRANMARDAGRLHGGRFRWDTKLVDEHVARIRQPSRLGYLLQIGAIAGWTSALWIWRLRQPTLILAGADDPIAPPVNGHILARLIPNSRLEILDEGHLFLIAQPEISARIVREFLDAEHPNPTSPKPWSEAMHSAEV